MRTATGRWLFLVCGLSCPVLGRPARADDPKDSAKAKERQKVIDRMIDESLVDYKLFANRESQAALRPHSVLRFVNDTRLLMHGEAVLVLWTDGGRPEALASLYPWGNGLAHEFVTLSRGGGSSRGSRTTSSGRPRRRALRSTTSPTRRARPKRRPPGSRR